MWPWEHVAFGYVLYSLFVHGWYRRRPDEWPVVAIGVATLLPDLIDKPLAWGLDVLPNARSLGHTVFFVVPLVAAVVLLARRRDAPGVGVAFAIGYASHLLGDVLYPVMRGGSVQAHYLYWPLGDQPVRETPGLVTRTANLFQEFLTYLAGPSGAGYLVLEIGLATAVMALWLADGRPGLGLSRRAVDRYASGGD